MGAFHDTLMDVENSVILCVPCDTGHKSGVLPRAICRKLRLLGLAGDAGDADDAGDAG